MMSPKRAKSIKPKRRHKRKGFQSLGVTRSLQFVAPDDDLRASVFEKTTVALQRIISKLPRETLLNALRTQTPVDALIDVMSSDEIVIDVALQVSDPLRAAKARAVKHLSELLSAEGGPLGVSEVCDRLGISRAAIDKRRRTGTLVGIVDRGRPVLYPAWQFTGSGLLPGLADVLRVIGVDDPWMRMQFFLTYDPDLESRPLDALREGRLADVIVVAKRYGRQGDDG